MTAVTEQLLDDGIKLFEDAMNSLLAGIDKAALGDRHRPSADDRREPAAGVRGARRPTRIKPRRLRERRPAHLEARPSRSGAAPVFRRSRTGSAG